MQIGTGIENFSQATRLGSASSIVGKLAFQGLRMRATLVQIHVSCSCSCSCHLRHLWHSNGVQNPRKDSELPPTKHVSAAELSGVWGSGSEQINAAP